MSAVLIAADGESRSPYCAAMGGRYNMAGATLLGHGQDGRSFFGEERH